MEHSRKKAKLSHGYEAYQHAERISLRIFSLFNPELSFQALEVQRQNFQEEEKTAPATLNASPRFLNIDTNKKLLPNSPTPPPLSKNSTDNKAVEEHRCAFPFHRNG